MKTFTKCAAQEEEKKIAFIAEMHSVIGLVADSLHQSQLALNKYVEAKTDYFAKKKKKPKVSNVQANPTAQQRDSDRAEFYKGTDRGEPIHWRDMGPDEVWNAAWKAASERCAQICDAAEFNGKGANYAARKIRERSNV